MINDFPKCLHKSDLAEPRDNDGRCYDPKCSCWCLYVPKIDGKPIPKQEDNCFHIHAIDGYETYKIDENTIGVSPIWFDAVKNPPAAMEDVLLVYDGRVIKGWNESTQPEEDPSYCSCELSIYPYIGIEGVTHWMPLPKPPAERIL